VSSREKELADHTAEAEPPVRKSRYCLITPCRDEARFARTTLDSVVRQTIPPACWVIVDDGSRDETPAIVEEYAARYPYIRLIRRTDRGERVLGRGVIEAFDQGYSSIRPKEFDYICKFDLDLEIPPAYFETLMERMLANPRIATCSGKPYMRINSRLVPEVCGDEHSVGMIKFYRVEAFRQIGGFVRELMWDGIDGHKCRLLGWLALSWDDPDIRFVHLRPMGTSHRNWWTGRVRHGAGQYYMGTSPAYLFASAAMRLWQPPRVLGSVAIAWGFIKGYVSRAPRYPDPAFRKFVRSYQWRALFMGKRRATEMVNARQERRWARSTTMAAERR